MNDDAFVDKIDIELAATQFLASVTQLVRRTDDRRHALRGEIIPEQDEFVRGRQIRPVEDRDVRHARGAFPFTVGRQQRSEQTFHRRELLQPIMLREDRHRRQFRQQPVQPFLIRETGRILRIVFDKLDPLSVNETVQAGRDRGGVESGIDHCDLLLGLGQTKLRH